MRFRIDGSGLRLPALLLAGSLVLGGSLLGLGLSIHANSAARLARAAWTEAEASRAAREAPARLQQDRRESDLYKRIRHSGFLGQEDRTGWITALGDVQSKMKLESLSWRLAPRSPSPLGPGLRVSAMDLGISNMDARQLDALFGELRETAPGRFTVERCSLVLNPDGRAGQVECRLNWWTWEDPSRRHD
jgi:hypothetical protein